MRKIWMRMLFVLFCTLTSVSAWASSCSATLSSLNFGDDSPISGRAVTASGTASVSCELTPGYQARVCLNLAGPSPRALLYGSNVLQFDVYQDPNYTQPWGAVDQSTLPIDLLFTQINSTQRVSFYGRIPAGQTKVPSGGGARTPYTTVNPVVMSSVIMPRLQQLPSCSALGMSGTRLSFSAGAMVVNNCTISVTPLAFGVVNLLNHPAAASATISATCTLHASFSIALDKGRFGSSVFNRQMKVSGASHVVQYQLYLDSAHTSIWGDATGGGVQNGTGSGVMQNFGVYGMVPQQITPAPGMYSDVVQATITF